MVEPQNDLMLTRDNQQQQLQDSKSQMKQINRSESPVDDQRPSSNQRQESINSQEKELRDERVYSYKPPSQQSNRQKSKISSITQAVQLKMNLKKFSKGFLTLFNKHHVETFGQLREQVCDMVDQLDEKMNGALEKKELDLLRAFKHSMAKVTQELHAMQEKYNTLNEDLKRDNKIVILEKQLTFFREQCLELNEIKKDQELRLTQLKNVLTDVQEQKNACHEAMLKLEEEVLQLRALFITQQEARLTSNNNAAAPQQQNQQHARPSVIVEEQYNGAVALSGQEDDDDEQQQDDAYYWQQQQESLRHESGQRTVKKQNQQQQNNVCQYCQQSQQSSLQSREDSIQAVRPPENQSTLMLQQSPLPSSQRNPVLHTVSRVTHSHGSQEYREALDLACQIASSQGASDININEMALAIQAFVRERLVRKERLVKQLRQQLTQQLRLSRPQQLASGEENELRALFERAVADVRYEIGRRSNAAAVAGVGMQSNGGASDQKAPAAGKFTKFDSVDLMRRFLLSRRFMEIVRAKVFEEKCCENANCKYNIKDEDFVQRVRIQAPTTSTDPVDEKFNQLLDQEMDIFAQAKQPQNSVIPVRAHYSYLPATPATGTVLPPAERQGNNRSAVSCDTSSIERKATGEAAAAALNYVDRVRHANAQMLQKRRLEHANERKNRPIDERISSLLNSSIAGDTQKYSVLPNAQQTHITYRQGRVLLRELKTRRKSEAETSRLNLSTILRQQKNSDLQNSQILQSGGAETTIGNSSKRVPYPSAYESRRSSMTQQNLQSSRIGVNSSYSAANQHF